MIEINQLCIIRTDAYLNGELFRRGETKIPDVDAVKDTIFNCRIVC